MPRRSSGRSSGYGRSRGFSGGRSYSSSRSPNYSKSPNYKSTNYSKPSSQPYTSQVQSRNLGGMGLGSMMATGMALGGGSALGHHIVGSMLGGHGRAQYSPSEQLNTSGPLENVENQPVQTENQIKQNENPCMGYNNKFIECLKDNPENISRCQVYFDDMITCEKSLRSIK
jgi:hypothetical protein